MSRLLAGQAAAERARVLAELAAAIETPRPGSALEARAPVVGYFCAYVPPEILLAAGLYPLRLRGRGVADSGSGDVYLSHLTCSFVRHVTAAVLDGTYDFLAGQIAVNSCDHVRRANDVLRAKSGLGFHGFVSVPRSFRQGLLPWYREELERLRAAIAEHFATGVSDAALAEAVTRTNRVRERLSCLDRLRREDPPRLLGSEVLTAAIAARVLPPEQFVTLADRLLQVAAASRPLAAPRVRVLLCGGELDDPSLVRTLESQGAQVAADLLCFGSRGLGERVDIGPPASDEHGDGHAAVASVPATEQAGGQTVDGSASGTLLDRLAAAYLHQVPCARMMGEFPRRFDHLLRLCREVGATGIVFQRIKFCQIWSAEAHNLRHRLDEQRRLALPMLVLDREYGSPATGQLRTRVQAFVERLGGTLDKARAAAAVTDDQREAGR